MGLIYFACSYWLWEMMVLELLYKVFKVLSSHVIVYIFNMMIGNKVLVLSSPLCPQLQRSYILFSYSHDFVTTLGWMWNAKFVKPMYSYTCLFTLYDLFWEARQKCFLMFKCTVEHCIILCILLWDPGNEEVQTVVKFTNPKRVFGKIATFWSDLCLWL